VNVHRYAVHARQVETIDAENLPEIREKVMAQGAGR
jgi:hypothetical protein